MDLYKITEKLESKGWDLNNDFLSNNEDFLQALIDETEKAISVTCCCCKLKEDKEYTFTLDVSNQEKTEELSKQLKELLSTPSEMYFIDKDGNRIRF